MLLSREEKIAIYTKRLDGATIQQLSEEYGVPREVIRAYVLPGKASSIPTKVERSCIYPNISAWMADQMHSYSSFAKQLDVRYETLWNALTGTTSPNKRLIDAILCATGMSYEEAFTPMQQ